MSTGAQHRSRSSVPSVATTTTEMTMHTVEWFLIAGSCGFFFWLGSFLARRSRATRLEKNFNPDAHPAATDSVGNLEVCVQSFRDKLTSQCEAVDHIANYVRQIDPVRGNDAWNEIVEEFLFPAQELSRELTDAYDRLRSNTDEVKSVHRLRTEPVTGLSNEFTMQEWLRMMFALMSRYGHGFSLVLVDVDNQDRLPRHSCGTSFDEIARRFAGLLSHAVRETDFLFRLENNQFAIALPETSLEGSIVFSRRVLSDANEQLSVGASIGVSMARDDDNMQSLIDRVQAAIFAAQSGGGNAIFLHTGRLIEAVPSREAVLA